MKNKPILQAFENKTPKRKEIPEYKQKDIIITKYKNETTYNEDGSKTVKRVPVMVNITKKVNETAKLVKEQTATEKLAELEKIFTK